MPQTAIQPRPTPDSGRSLSELENVIEVNLSMARDAWVQVALALREVKDRFLYVDRYATFEEWVESRYQRTRQWAYQLIDSVTTLVALNGATAADPPVVARHLRELSGAGEHAVEAWDTASAAASAEGRRVTTADITSAVNRLRGTPSAPITQEDHHESLLRTAVRIAARMPATFRARLIDEIGRLP